MFKLGRTLAAVTAAGVVLTGAACSSTGGKQAETGGAAAGAAGRANTPHMTFAMVTHAGPGQTFWDIVRKGAETAAAKDNVALRYSSDPGSGNQATLIQGAIDAKVDGIAVTLSDPPALVPAVQKAVAAGIPVVALNAGISDYQPSGALAYFGSDETVAGHAAGKKATDEGAKHVLCVIHAQGQIQLENRCNGVQSTFKGGRYSKIYVNGTDLPAVHSTIDAKLKQDPSIDFIVALDAPIALTTITAVSEAESKARIGTFDFNPEIPAKIKSGELVFAIDQQPWLQGYEAIDSLWLYKVNGHVLGGGQPTLTGPFLVDKSNVDLVAQFAANGTR